MKLQNITSGLTKTFNKVGFWARKNSPELLVATGIITAAASIVLASKATLKVEPIVKQANSNIKEIKSKMNDDNLLANDLYSKEDGKKELFQEYRKVSWEVIKLYTPSVLSFSLSVAAILSSHKIMKGRNFALAAAYTTMENSYRSYRERVQAKIGETAEKEIFRNIYSDEYTETVTDKNGKEKEVTKKAKMPHLDPDNEFAYLFDESNPDWTKHGKWNLDFLLAKEKYLNQKLKSQGYLFLHDVYESLGIEPGMIGDNKLQASRILGWIYDPEDDTRDNYVSFGLADRMGNLTEESMDLIRNNERNIWLEFNPDGDILTGSGKKKTFMKYANVI